MAAMASGDAAVGMSSTVTAGGFSAAALSGSLLQAPRARKSTEMVNMTLRDRAVFI
jgi:hypothetical protein